MPILYGEELLIAPPPTHPTAKMDVDHHYLFIIFAFTFDI
jgi:hypothetical protein